jgi:C1A family cysteine protease
VRNQGDRPTCVAFAASAAHEWIDTDHTIRSAEDAMWAAHQIGGVPGREEISVNWALTGLQTHAHGSEAAWPYGAPRWPDGRPVAAHDSANRRALPGWRMLADSGFASIAGALDDGHAVVVTVRVVPSAWRRADAIIDADPGRKTPGNHAVLAVGALSDPDRIIVKNSWGEGWGRDGYGFLTRRYLEHYALRAHVLEAP